MRLLPTLPWLASILVTASAPIRAEAADAPPAKGAGEALPGPVALRTGSVMMALGCVTTAYATWSWSTNTSRVALLEHLEGGPHMDWTAVDAPAASVLLMSLGGVEAIRGARGRGAPSGYWLGLVPAAIALGVEAVALVEGDEPTRAQELAVAVGTAASAAWFGASTLRELLRAHPGGAGADEAGGRRARSFAVVPVVGWSDGGGHVGVAMAGTL